MGDDVFPPSPIWSPMSTNYDWPRNTKQDDINYVIHGGFKNLPHSRSKVVRIFLSSTFLDFQTERNCLMRDVYPKLKQKCKEEFDLDFQVVDMRWGIKKVASVDHSSGEICMKEIHNCQKLSVGPTFVTFLSHRYGARNLPVKIPCEEMKKIKDIIKSEENPAKDILIVEKWYKLDTNAKPNEYILQPIVHQDRINQLFLQITSTDINSVKPVDETKVQKEYEKLVEEGQDLWEKEKENLTSVVRSAVMKAIEKGDISEESGQKYIQSITEAEIREGVLKEKEERRKDRVLAFVRDIKDINMEHKDAWMFVDNEETTKLMKKVRDDLIPQNMPSENIYRFETTWSDNGGINEENNSDYIREFRKKFEDGIMRLIEKANSAAETSVVDDKVYYEALEHGHQCVKRVERFLSREDILETIKSYLMSTSNQPLVIHGESGYGKSSVMAKAAEQIPSWLGEDNNTVVILRFLGTTPDSSTIYKTLASVSEQLMLSLKFKLQLPQEFSDLKDVFKDILRSVPEDKHVVIFLDSLDQLSATNNAHNLQWLPSQLPKNVKFVVSTLPEKHDILYTLKSEHMKLKESQFVLVEKMKSRAESTMELVKESRTGYDIIMSWLDKIHRSLSERQKNVTRKLFESDYTPLYLKLVFDEISLWKSYENPNFECQTIPACLQHLYTNLEMKHGKMLVSRALGYLTASENGLTEIEMEDILSLDNEALKEVFEFHIPPITRLPSILWVRIRCDIQEYIVDREADGAKVMTWFHGEFIQEAQKKYLHGNAQSSLNEESLQLYKNIADYFAGVWGNGKLKPIKYTEKQAEMLKRDSDKTDRYVPEQPVLFTSERGTIDFKNLKYNRRKLSELPAAVLPIAHSEGSTEYIAKHILLNQEFLAAWIIYTPWDEISDFMDSVVLRKALPKIVESVRKDMSNAKAKHKRKINFDWKKVTTSTNSVKLQMSTIQQCLLLSYVCIRGNPTYLGVDVTGRMLQYYNLDGIKNWVNYTDGEGRKLCALVPPHMQLETGGGILRFIINNHVGPVSTALWAEHDTDICVSASTKLVAVELQTGQITIDTRPRSIPEGDFFKEIVTVKYNNDPYYLASLSETPWIYVFDVEGEVFDEIDIGSSLGGKNSKITNMQINIKEFSLYVTVSSLPYIIRVDNVFLKDVKVNFHVIKFETSIQLQVVARGLTVVLDTRNIFYLCDRKQSLSQKSFVWWPKVTANCYSITENQENVHKNQENVHIVLGFETGQICIIQLKDSLKNAEELNPVYLFMDSQIRDKETYGIPHYVHHHIAGKGKFKFKNYEVALACTNTHLVAFSSKCVECTSDEDSSEYTSSEGDTKYSSSEDDNDYDTDAKEDGLITICRIKKKYKVAVYTPRLKFILAAHGGTIDILRIGTPCKAQDGKLEVTYFFKIDAHSQDITRILPSDEDILFMTSSEDSSLKFYMLTRVGAISKHIPDFQHSESVITKIIPGGDYALTSSDSPRTIHQWEVVNGRIKNVFQHPKNKHFMKVATDDKMHRVMALDEEGTFFSWEKKDNPNLRSSKGHCRDPTKPGPSKAVSRNYTTTPHVDEKLISSINLPLNMNDIHMLVFLNGITVIASKKSDHVFIVETEKQNIKASKIEDLKGPFIFAVKLKEEKILFVSKKNHAFVYNIISRQVELKDPKILGSGSIDNFLTSSNKVIFSTENTIYSWKPEAGSKVSRLYLPKQSNIHLMATISANLVFVLDSNNKSYVVLNVDTNAVLHKREITIPTPIQMNTCTPDGKYLVLVSGDKHLYLIRVSDGRVLAWYTMYDTVRCITTSGNGWYILIATSDKRLFVLIIADPDEREHDKRIKKARKSNPALKIEEAMHMMIYVNDLDDDSSDEEYNTDDNSDHSSDSDIEDMIDKAEERIPKWNKNALGNPQVLYSSDDSGDEEKLVNNHQMTKKQRNKADASDYNQVASKTCSLL